ncbi:type II toxin-antitoxin system RelE/ParE family toxin [Maribrevibacterium harenarium]|uniref:Type II toxin-antitoxin system RelE/ParE family toxin n=1 Tax=Maribrevibacterium harenarium TaxID=2589817 RepID=A0A501X3D8_9GAMM|nr:type II toxin-antitoxin system RelE/ParE family toxin [Maribrevibacterium harenarium]TPE54937.1 type II toxin-antitoxin system RelE/ParE family toxin [Maribrevibacterium harenarium]
MESKTRKKISAYFYRSVSGNEPLRDWLLSLPKEDRSVIGQGIKLVEYGWPIGMPVCRSMGDGLWEVRTTLSGGRIARVIFCFHDDRLVLLHGFIKKSQKTPKPDLELGKKRQREVEHG